MKQGMKQAEWDGKHTGILEYTIHFDRFDGMGREAEEFVRERFETQLSDLLLKCASDGRAYYVKRLPVQKMEHTSNFFGTPQTNKSEIHRVVVAFLHWEDAKIGDLVYLDDVPGDEEVCARYLIQANHETHMAVFSNGPHDYVWKHAPQVYERVEPKYGGGGDNQG